MTAGGGQWAEAEVGVTLNWDNVEGELKRRLEQASAKAAAEVRKNWAKLYIATKKAFERMSDAFATQMTQMELRAAKAAKNINRILGTIKSPKVSLVVENVDAIRQIRVAHKDMQKYLRDHPLTVRINVSADLDNLSREWMKMQAWLLAHPLKLKINAQRGLLGTGSAGGGKDGLGGLLGTITKLGKSAAGALGTLGKFTALAGAATVAVAGLTPAVAALSVALGSALFSTAVAGAGAFAAGLTAVAGIVATVKTATAGVGDAIKNAFDPENAEKFAEAMAKLAPQAQSFVRAFQTLGVEFKRIVQQPVQNAFFAGLGPQVQQLTKYLVPVRDAMLTIADGFNEGAVSALKFVNSARGMSTVGTLLRESANMGANFGAALGNLVPGILAIGAGASSVFGPMTDGIGGVARELSNLLVEAQQSGAMAQFFQDAIGVAKQLWFVLQQVGGIFSAVFSAAAEAGDGVLGGLATKLQTINAYLSAGEGREALVSFFQSMQAAVGTLLPILLQVAGIIGGQVAPAIAELIVSIGPALQGLIQGFGLAIAQITPVVPILATALSSIGTALAPVLPILGQLIATFVQIAGPIISALATALGPILQTVGQSLIVLLQALMPAVQPIADLFVALGPVISQLASMLAGALGSALQVLVPVVVMLVQGLTLVLPVLTGMLQMLQPISTGLAAFAAAAVVVFAAFKAWQVISTIISAIRTAWMLLSIAFAISPIGMIIVGVTALIAALALFFTKTELGKQIWDAIWTGIKATWDVVWAGIKAGLDAIGAAVMWLWQNVMQPAWTAIQFIIQVAWFAIQVYFKLWQLAFKAVGAVVMWLWQNVVQPAFSAIGSIIGAVWDAVVRPALDGFMAGLRVVGDVATWLWNNAIVPAWNGIKAAIEGVWKIVKPILGWIGDGFQTMGDIASKIAGGIKSAFSGVVDVIKAPIRAIGGLLAGLPDSVFGIDIPGVGTLKEWGRNLQALRSGGPVDIRAYANGSHGPIKGPGTTTSDSILARLSRGEYVLPAMAVNKDTLPLIEALRAGWTPPAGLAAALPAFAEGGQVGGREAYGLPVGSSVSYGDPDKFPEWVHALEKRFGVQASTYPGHQEKSGQNKGIDWSGPVANMQRFAEFALSNKGDLEQVIWMNPQTGQQIGVADGQQVGPGTSQSGYYRDDWSGHTDHVHTRQSYAWGGGNTGPAKGIDTSGKTASTPSLGGSTTPIGSGLGGSPSGSSSAGSSSPSWGNSGGGSKFNSAEEADKGGVVPVWVENWPAIMGGGAAATPSGSPTLGGTPDPAVGLTGKPSTVDTIPLKKNKDGTWTSTDPEWAKLIARESGGRADRVQEIQDANSGGNEASGLFQIAKGTWAGHGGTKYAPTAGQATPEQQAEIAAAIFNKSGGSPWGSGKGQNFGRENEDALRKGIQRKGTAPAGTKADPVAVTTVNKSTPLGGTPAPDTTTTDTTATLAPATTTQKPKRPTLDAITLGGSSFSGQAGGAAKAGTKYAVDSVLFDNPGALGKFDNSKAQTSLGTRAGDVANTAVSGQLGAALGIFGLDLQPPVLDAVGQYITDNPLTSPAKDGEPVTQKNLVDLVSDLARQAWEAGSVSVVVQGNADGDDVANKVDNSRRRKMRRYVKPAG